MRSRLPGLPLVAALLLVGCLAEAPESPSTPGVTTGRQAAAPLVDLSGDWVLSPLDQSTKQTWHLKQVGNVLTGTYEVNTDLPGSSPAPQSLSGRLQPGGLAASMDAPGGLLQISSASKFSFCATGHGEACFFAARLSPAPIVGISVPPGITVVPAGPEPSGLSHLPVIVVTTSP